MNVILTKTTITQDVTELGFEKNNGVDIFTATVDTDTNWEYKLDVKYSKKSPEGEYLYNIIDLSRNGNICSALLTSAMLPFSGKYLLQLRGVNGEEVYHTDVFEAWVKYSIEPGATYDPVPSEFYQIEQNISELNSHPPIPGDNGYWLIWNLTTKQYEESTFPLPSFDLSNYYTKEQVDSVIETNIENVTDGLADGTIVPAKATSATNDGKGNVIDETYATKDEMAEQAPVVALSTDDTITNTTFILTDEQIESLKNEQAIIKISCSDDNSIYFFRLEQGYIEFTDNKVYNTFSFLGSETDGIAYQLTLEPTQKKAKIYKTFEFGDRSSIENIIDGITVVAKANADAKGNIIDTTYVTNTKLEQKLTLINLAPTSSIAIEEGSIELTPTQKTAFDNADKYRLIISVGPLGDGLADYSYFYVSGIHPSGSVISYYFNSPNGYTGHIDYMWTDSTITFNYTKTPEYATKSSVDTLTTKVTQNTTDIGNKVDKINFTPVIDMAYGVNAKGEAEMFGIAKETGGGTLAQRDDNGEIAVATPTQNGSATNKSYVDGLVGNINTILATMFNDVEVTE